MDKRIGFQSALLVSAGVIVGAFVGAVLAFRIGAAGAGILLTAVAVTGLVSRLWGLYALRGLEAEVLPSHETLSVGQSVTVHYTLKNNKALPLIWAEVCQDVPARGCLAPDDSFRMRRFSEEEAQHTGRAEAYMRRFAFVMGMSELSWDTEWTGVRRGVYRPQDLVLRSGDGFGLTQSAGTVSGLHGRMLVVWPRLVPVDTGPFLRHVWTGNTGRAGYQEDPTVMRGERAYQPGDPWKRIDWRTAARTDELMVRQFDTVTPLSVLFLLDAASLSDPEEAISLTASLIRALSVQGVDCGLALPATNERPPLLLRPEDPAVTPERCLFALSEFDAETAGARFDEAEVCQTAAQSGQVWLVAESAAKTRCAALAGRLSASGLRLLAARDEPGAAVTRVCTFDSVRRREAPR